MFLTVYQSFITYQSVLEISFNAGFGPTDCHWGSVLLINMKVQIVYTSSMNSKPYCDAIFIKN